MERGRRLDRAVRRMSGSTEWFVSRLVTAVQF
jgi:hypothetical protein